MVWYGIITSHDVTSQIRLCQMMRIYLNNPAKFHPHLIWNDGALGKSIIPTRIRWVEIWNQFLIQKTTYKLTKGDLISSDNAVHCSYNTIFFTGSSWNNQVSSGLVLVSSFMFLV